MRKLCVSYTTVMEWTNLIITPNQHSPHLPFSYDLMIPFLGHVECGLFGISEDYEEAYLSLDQHMVKNRESTYFLRATGSSMHPLIVPGDILVVDRSRKVSSGQIVVANYNGERLCKRFINDKGKLWLHSENLKYKSIPIALTSELLIFGPVIGLARHL